MREVAAYIGVSFSETMLYPSWNGSEIKESIAPWGTVLKSTRDYNASIIDELSSEEKTQIVSGTTALARHFGYHEVDYLRKYFGAE